MKKTNINYPHPVLSVSNEDYINCAFDLEIINDPQVDGNIITLALSYTLSCPSLEALISSGDACAVVYVESPVAEYRKIFRFSATENELTVPIDKNLVNKKIEVRGHIIATKPLSPFKFPEHNKELLGDVPFNINPGEILAISDHFYNIPVDAYDPLADRPSIFSIRQQNDHPDEDISVDIFSDDKIRILLNRETYDKYRKLYEAPEVRTVLASMFAVPVLVDVLSYIKHAGVDELESVSTKKWYSVILSRLSALNIDLSAESSMTKVANIVLPNVFKTSVESFTQVFDALIPSGGANNED